MMAVEIMLQHRMSLRNALEYSGCSRSLYYYEQTPRVVGLDPLIVKKVQEIALERPSYGTRRMAAMLSRELDVPVNRKRVQRVYRALNWVAPSMKKGEIMRAKTRLVAPERPDELWESDLTYVWCGSRDRWCYLFNVFDVFTRRWLGYAFDTSAVKENAIMAVSNVLAAHREVDTSTLRLRVDNGPQYTSNAFTGSMDALGIRLEYIFRNTPEQNGHIESFHKTLKKEYLWPRDLNNYQEAEIVIGGAFTDYNAKRIHSSLGYKTPYEFLSEWRVHAS